MLTGMVALHGVVLTSPAGNAGCFASTTRFFLSVLISNDNASNANLCKCSRHFFISVNPNLILRENRISNNSDSNREYLPELSKTTHINPAPCIEVVLAIQLRATNPFPGLLLEPAGTAPESEYKGKWN